MGRGISPVFSVGRGEVGINSLSLDKNCMSYLSLLLGLESFKKFVVGGGWVGG